MKSDKFVYSLPMPSRFSGKALVVDSLTAPEVARGSSAARVETAEGEGGWRARAGVRFARKLARRYAVPVVLATGLHAAVLLMPAGGWLSGGEGAGDAGAQTATVGFAEAAWSDPAGGAQGGERGEPAGGETVPAPDAGALAAAAQEALAELRAMTPSADAAAFAIALAGGGAAVMGAGGGAGPGDLGAPAWRGGSTGHDGAMAFAGGSGALRGGARRGGGMLAAFMPDPFYPETARRERCEGVVELAVGVGAHGRADWVSVSRSSGRADLDEAARNVVQRQWRFHRGGQEPRECMVRITFSLDRG
ncbi:MAG: energy transducer TonB [Opitutaceae bacterium]|jgi:TonB family protein|nr:energy transducer TonB [Opitutaceae bacterium]